MTPLFQMSTHSVPARRRSFHAVSLIEVLIAMAVSTVLIVVVYGVLVSGRKGMVRGEHKLDDVGETGRLFGFLEKDLHALRGGPPISGADGVTLDVWLISKDPHDVTTRTVTYGLEGGEIVRTVDPASDDALGKEQRFGKGRVVEWTLGAADVRGHPGLRVEVTYEGEHDAARTVFARTFFFRNLERDETWIPLPR